jgi:hypothetical protein
VLLLTNDSRADAPAERACVRWCLARARAHLQSALAAATRSQSTNGVGWITSLAREGPVPRRYALAYSPPHSAIPVEASLRALPLISTRSLDHLLDSASDERVCPLHADAPVNGCFISSTSLALAKH